jgi:hypothetical protein
VGVVGTNPKLSFLAERVASAAGPIKMGLHKVVAVILRHFRGEVSMQGSAFRPQIFFVSRSVRSHQPHRVFFQRRMSVSKRAFGSLKTPRTLASGRKPGNAYASHSQPCRLRKLAMERHRKTPYLFKSMNTSTGAASRRISIRKPATRVREEIKNMSS